MAAAGQARRLLGGQRKLDRYFDGERVVEANVPAWRAAGHQAEEQPVEEGPQDP